MRRGAPRFCGPPSHLVDRRRSSSAADSIALDRNDLGAGAQFVQVIGPRLQHLVALLEELSAVVGTAQRILHGVREKSACERRGPH